MKATQIYLDNETHLKMKEIVLKEKTTNYEFIIQAVKEKIERYKENV